MEIDDINKLTRFSRNEITPSDHSNLFLHLNVKRSEKSKRIEIFNLKDSESLTLFKKETTKSTKLTESFIKVNTTEQQIDEWKNSLDSIMKKCFKKIRLGGKTKVTEVSKLINERAKFKETHAKSSGKEKERLSKLIDSKDDEIAKYLETQNSEKVFKNFNSFADTSGVFNTNGMWKLKKKIFPTKNKSSILAKKNDNGKLVTNPMELKSLYLRTYVNRLRHRQIKPGFENLKLLKEYLCTKRLEITKENQAPRLTRNKMDRVLKDLKTNKARDPHGLINEMFKQDATGQY